MKFIKFYRGFSKFVAFVLMVCLVTLTVIGSKVVRGTAITDTEFVVFCVSLVAAAAIGFCFLILECAYQRAIAREIARKQRKRRGV